MRALLTSLIVLALATPALAGEEKGKDKDKALDGQYVKLSPVALPVIADGQLINYVFVTLQLNLTPSASTAVWRDKEPYFRDALVHTAFRRPFTVPTSYTTIDIPALKARMKAEAVRITGPGVIASVELVGEPQAKRVSGLPKPRGAAPEPSRPLIP